MTKLPFKQVDVFTEVPYKGNPVAVVMNGDGLSDTQMQDIANWTNLSETTFVCTAKNPAADYWLRIFNPLSEMKFAGHPSLGSAQAIRESGFISKNDGMFVQETAGELIDIYFESEKLYLIIPKATFKPVSSERLNQLLKVTNIEFEQIEDATVVNAGANWLILQLNSADQVLNVVPQMAELAAITPDGENGLVVFGMYDDSDFDIEVRAFAPRDGVNEDPVCGSGNGCVASLIKEKKLIDKSDYLAGQGQLLGRDGRVTVKFINNQVLVGGNAVTCVDGKLII